MTMNGREFKKNLLLYGADVKKWPSDICRAGLEALEKSSGLRAVSAEHEHFESVLKTVPYEEPNSDLARRIVRASLQREKKAPHRFAAFLSDLLAEFNLPRPALTIVSVLMIVVTAIGFAIGFSNSMGPIASDLEQANLQEFLYYEGETL